MKAATCVTRADASLNPAALRKPAPNQAHEMW